ncbi:MAG: sensor histidine kinase [Planctomycetota bacterium]
MTNIVEKRLSLHKNLQDQRQLNGALKSQITQLQTLANVGTTTYMVAHEINNLLTPLGIFAELALKHPDDKALIEKALRKAVRNCKQASKIMESMLAVADGETQDKKNVPLMALVQEVFACLCRDFAKDVITVNIEIAEDLTVWGVRVQIQQALMNLILNARDAMLPHGGVLTIKACDTDTTVQIEIADTGCGIDRADLEKIFEPFFTTKNDKNLPSRHSGSGLGLVFCKRIIDEHGGCVSVESKPAEGTAFKIILPKPS